jgi:hypothetical protein
MAASAFLKAVANDQPLLLLCAVLDGALRVGKIAAKRSARRKSS